jgi:hypothetical protein
LGKQVTQATVGQTLHGGQHQGDGIGRPGKFVL